MLREGSALFDSFVNRIYAIKATARGTAACGLIEAMMSSQSQCTALNAVTTSINCAQNHEPFLTAEL